MVRTLKEAMVTYSTTNISQGHVTDVPSCTWYLEQVVSSAWILPSI